MKTDLIITSSIAEQFTITSKIYLDPLSLDISSQVSSLYDMQSTIDTLLQLTAGGE